MTGVERFGARARLGPRSGRWWRPVAHGARWAGRIVLLAAVSGEMPGSELQAQEAGDRVRGARAELVGPAGVDVLRGELLAAGGDRVWILQPQAGAVEVSLPGLREARVQLHDWTGNRILRWTLLGGGLTSAGMFGACISVESGGDCGVFTLLWAGLWAGVGGVSYLLVPSAWARFAPPEAHDLRPYARFPQGLPEGYEVRLDARGWR